MKKPRICATITDSNIELIKEAEPLVDYFAWSVRLLRTGGLLLCDNAFLHGTIVDPTDRSAATEGVRAFNRLAAADARLVSTVVPVRDGIVVAVKIAP